MAFAYGGAWAKYTVAQDNVPLEQAAILADAVSTPFGAVVRTGKVGIGESVGVWGIGGVGTHIVQLARLVGAVPVIAVDIKPAALDRALELGARLRVRGRRPRVAGQDHRAHQRPQARCRVRRGGSEVDVRAGAGFGRGLRPPCRRGLQRPGADGWTDGHVRFVAEAGPRVSRSISDVVSLEDIRVAIEKLERQEGNPIRILVK